MSATNWYQSLTWLHPDGQAGLGCCSAMVIKHAIEAKWFEQSREQNYLSALFIYQQESRGNWCENLGGYVANAINVARTIGVPLESLWPYNTSKYCTEPPLSVYADAANRKLIGTAPVVIGMVGILDTMRALLTARHPICVELPWFYDYTNANLGLCTRLQYEGGHAITLTDYDDSTQLFRFINSMGSSWGLNGWGFIPYSWFDGSLGPTMYVSTAAAITSVDESDGVLQAPFDGYGVTDAELASLQTIWSQVTVPTITLAQYNTVQSIFTAIAGGVQPPPVQPPPINPPPTGTSPAGTTIVADGVSTLTDSNGHVYRIQTAPLGAPLCDWVQMGAVWVYSMTWTGSRIEATDKDNHARRYFWNGTVWVVI